MTTIEVFQIGSQVMLSDDGEVKGRITAICLRETGITYEVVWWDGRSRRCEWITGGEMSCKQKKMQIGFKTESDQRIEDVMRRAREKVSVQ